MNLKPGSLYQTKMDLCLAPGAIRGAKESSSVHEIPMMRDSYFLFLEENSDGIKVLYGDITGWISSPGLINVVPGVVFIEVKEC